MSDNKKKVAAPTDETEAASEDTHPQPQAHLHHPALIAAAATVAGLALGAIIALGAVQIDSVPADKTGSEPVIAAKTGSDENAPAADSETDEHTHDWTITYKTVHHDAVTHTETVAPVYGNETSYHTVCNDCEQVIDGKADQHIKETGHSGYSTNVPITDEVLVTAGYTHEVTDKAAYDETIPDVMVCTVCGAEQELPAESE